MNKARRVWVESVGIVTMMAESYCLTYEEKDSYRIQKEIMNEVYYVPLRLNEELLRCARFTSLTSANSLVQAHNCML